MSRSLGSHEDDVPPDRFGDHLVISERYRAPTSVIESVNAQNGAICMNLQPLEDRIVVRPNDAEATTASGLVIPDTAKEKPQQGEVLAVGAGRRADNGELIPMDVSAGDTVVYSKYGGTEITIDGEDVLILSARDVLAIVK